VLPSSLTVEALKLRIDKQLSKDDGLLLEYLEGAFQQAQASAPLGCGRLLVPSPALVERDEGEPTDTADPVTRTFAVRGQRVMIPDAREITKVEVNNVEVPHEGVDERGYHQAIRTELMDDGTQVDFVVRLDLPRPETWSSENDWSRDNSRRKTGKITGRFGFLTIPKRLAEAIYILAARAYYEREAQFADQVAVGEGATASTYYRQLPPRTRLAFESFALPSGVGGLS